MMILFVVLSFVMVFILIWQQIQHKKLVREIDYITSRLDTISVISENGFVLIPTDNDSIKKLSAALNKLLQDFYTKKSQFEQSKQASGAYSSQRYKHQHYYVVDCILQILFSLYQISLSFNQSFLTKIRSVSISSPCHFHFVL